MYQYITNNDIRGFLGIESSSEEFMINQVDSLGNNSNTLMFIVKPDMNLEELDCSIHCVYLIDDSYKEFQSTRNDFIRVKNPKYKFCLIQKKFTLESKLQREFTYKYINLPSYVVRHCSEIIIGESLHVDDGVIIGGTDFSPVYGESRDDLLQFPQLGGVKIGDNVTLKYNTMIGKGTFGFTQIGSNTMIDFGCQIGHNCIIGKSCIIAAGTIIGGSTIVGDDTTIGIGATIRNGIKIGRNVSIGMGSVVIKDVPDNSVVVGNPARIIEHDPIFSTNGLV